ncbi:MAG: flagellar basal body rod modification protein [Pseudooceanicola sp.]|jgi:flagellar basal-body rod modification protein FlgD|nr:flagellar basal body rod modification protein [Pseudooceanicola sp.]|tara:strand:+ start:4777 stop:5457 length:681 start_codon:yes stop_codon:yes gene_type:complete
MVVDTVGATGTTPATTGASSAGSSGKSAIAGLTSDFETFIKLLTTQAKYQDPLEPLDSTEYASQLAQFSMVEQQVKTNDSLEAMVAGMLSRAGLSGQADSLAAWIGRDIRAAAPVSYTGTAVEIAPKPTQTADKAQLVVKSLNGTEVQRLDIPVSRNTFMWTGGGLGHGDYTFHVESFKSGKLEASSQAEVYGRVNEAQIDGESIKLVLSTGQTIDSNDVTAMRAG